MNAKVKYGLAVLGNAAISIVPLLSGGAAAFLYFIGETVTTYDEFGKEITTKKVGQLTPPVILLGIVFLISVICVVLFKSKLKAFLSSSMEQAEYDEFGRSKKKSIANMTRKEREAIDMQNAANMERLIPTMVMKSLVHEGSTTPDEDMAKLIGIQPVKDKIEEMTARMKFEAEEREEILRTQGKKALKNMPENKNSMSGRHFCFYGSAGTGKTTVARILTGFLFRYGYIKENKCVEIDGNFLKCGLESGQKTKLICQKSYGGVLFIDEAYTMIDGNPQIGKEIIATLIKEMEDHRDKFTVIIAGYKNDMIRLIETNEGFKSRIKEYLEFPDYSVDEMAEIFKVMASSEGYEVSEGAMENFKIRITAEKAYHSFGNGRTVRNVLDETLDRHSINYGKGILEEKDGDTVIRTNAENRKRICAPDVSASPNKNAL